MTATSAAIDDLAATNRPPQLDLLGRVADHLMASPAVTHLLVRGSFACGDSDRLSDVDLVVGVDPGAFASFVAVHDALAVTGLNAIMPGWPDKIVPRLGGVGYVHLVEHGGKLHQLDLYLAPAYRIAQIAEQTRGHLIHATAAPVAAEPDPQVEDFIARTLTAPATCAELLIETMVLAWMIRKRLARGQQFMAYAENHLLTAAARSLIRTALQPATAYYGWYHLDELAATSLGRACLRDLSELITSDPVPNRASLTHTMERILSLARRAAPDAVSDLRLSLDAYLHHLDLA